MCPGSRLRAWFFLVEFSGASRGKKSSFGSGVSERGLGTVTKLESEPKEWLRRWDDEALYDDNEDPGLNGEVLC